MTERSKSIFYTEMDSPIGSLIIASTDSGICWLGFGKNEDALFALTRWTKRWLSTDKLERSDDKLNSAVQQLTEYFNGTRKNFELSVDLYGTTFQKLVWDSLLSIPYL